MKTTDHSMTTNTDELKRLAKSTDLIERLKQSEGPDIDLDTDIATELFKRDWNEDDGFFWLKPCGRQMTYGDIPEYTSSTNEAIELTEELLPRPDYGWAIFSHGKAIIVGGYMIEAEHKSPAIALLIALLQAVQATGETGS